MIPFTPVNSLPHLRGGGEAGEEEREGRREKKATTLPVVISFGISAFLWLLLAALEGGGALDVEGWGGGHCVDPVSPFARHEPCNGCVS